MRLRPRRSILALPFALVLVLGACASRRPPTPIAPGVLPPVPPPVLSGTIGNRPFVARSAIMLPPTHWSNGGWQQVLRVYERDVDCAGADAFESGRGMPGERYVEVTIGGVWPLYPNSVWQAAIGREGARDGSGVDIAFGTVRGGGGRSGALTSVEVRVLEASRGAGVVAIRAARTTDDPFMRGVAPKDVDPSTLGSVAGNVAFLVCEGGHGG